MDDRITSVWKFIAIRIIHKIIKMHMKSALFVCFIKNHAGHFLCSKWHRYIIFCISTTAWHLDIYNIVYLQNVSFRFVLNRKMQIGNGKPVLKLHEVLKWTTHSYLNGLMPLNSVTSLRNDKLNDNEHLDQYNFWFSN